MLIITRPTQGTAAAVVHNGVVAGPMAGQGQSMVWEKQEDGRWVETGEGGARWLSKGNNASRNGKEGSVVSCSPIDRYL